MRASLIFLLLSTVSVAQSPPPGGVKVQGACNQVVAGNGNQVTLNCNGISKEKAAQLVRLLNTIISRQLDPDEVYAQLNQISAKVDSVNAKVESVNLSIAPLTGMPQEEQSIFLTAQRLYSDCNAAGADWVQAKSNAAQIAMRNMVEARNTYMQNPSNVAARQAYLKAAQANQQALIDLSAASSSANSIDQAHIARYHAELEPQLLKSRAQILALSPDSSSMSSPDYDAVSSSQQLGAVCNDFNRIGTNAYNSESQRVRNNVVHPAQPPPH